MGTFGAKGDELTDTVKKDVIMPSRMAQIMKTAADITERLVSSKYLHGAKRWLCIRREKPAEPKIKKTWKAGTF